LNYGKGKVFAKQGMLWEDKKERANRAFKKRKDSGFADRRA